MAKEETVKVVKCGRYANPLKKNLDNWLASGWALVKQNEPTKGESK